jgi:sugar lactone lactonase YvrE
VPEQRELNAEPVLHARARLGEGPAWDAAAGVLWWVDILDRRVHRFNPATGRDREIVVGDAVGFAVPGGDASLVAGLRREVVRLDPWTGVTQRIAALPEDDAGDRLNDGKCDPRGRLWFGTLSKEEGRAALYRLDAGGEVQRMETGLTISNGLGWSPDGGTFYLTDSPKKLIYVYDFDAEAGTIADRRVFADLSRGDAFPDGLAVDAEGGVWSAQFAGGCVLRFAADGRETHRVRLPVPNPTSCAFGGADLRDLYVTTASAGLSEEQLDAAPESGTLFRLRAPIAGLPVSPMGTVGDGWWSS